MPAYYNEIDAHAAAWLRELIGRNLIAPGDVDERSIVDVRDDDLRGYTQCHFFAGIGVWSYALRLAGWPDDRSVWTGSCPCQPFSAAGKGDGYADERHLWPHWLRLIGECSPPAIFGEQVDAAIRTGWLDDVCLSLESLGYAIGAVDFPACSVGAPHIRQRIYFVAESECGTAERHRSELGSAARGMQGEGLQRQRLWHDARDGGESVAVADAEHAERWTVDRSVEDERNGNDDGRQEAHGIAGTRCEIRELADAGSGRRHEQRGLAGIEGESWQRGRESDDSGVMGDAASTGREAERRQAEQRGDHADSASATNGFWRDAIWLPCRDGKARAIEPGTLPLVDGAPARVVRLRGYGNGLVAEQARAFIEAYLDMVSA